MKKPFYQTLILTCSLSAFGISPSCNGTKNVTTQNGETMQTERFQTSYDVSARTRLFLAELDKEMSAAKSSTENFKPSDKLTEAYNIREQDGNYFISGFVKTNDRFDRSTLEQVGVALGQATGTITTVQIPLNALSQFLQTAGIDYFEISEKATNK